MRLSYSSFPGRSDRPNEDFIAATSEALVLLDGAGTPPGSESGCSHGVPWYVRILGVRLLEAVTNAPTADLAGLLSGAIKQTAELHAETCDLDHPGSPSSTVVMVREHAGALDYLVLCDSVLVLDRGDGVAVVTDDRLEDLARRYRPSREHLASDSQARIAAEREYVKKVREYRNVEGGYWVASADPQAADQALTGRLRVDQLHGLAALTDGATRLVDLFQQATWIEAMSGLAESGPSVLLDRVRDIERSDRDGRSWPRGKCHDDATAAFAVPG